MEAGRDRGCHAYTTHGVMSGPAVERITGSVLKIHGDSPTRSRRQRPVAACPNIRVLPPAPILFAQAIVNILERAPASFVGLFDTGSLVPIYEGPYPRGCGVDDPGGPRRGRTGSGTSALGGTAADMVEDHQLRGHGPPESGPSPDDGSRSDSATIFRRPARRTDVAHPRGRACL